MKKVLILAAHPDDEVLGCGGILSKYQGSGVEFKIVFIGEGSSCRYTELDSKESKDAINFRNACAIKALDSLGVQNFVFHNLPCGRFDQIPIIEINKIIEKEITSFSPDTLFTHSVFDANNDHKIVFHSTIMATRPGAKNSVSKLYSFEVLSSSEWNFQSPFVANYFESLSEQDVENKWKALEIYESETKEFPFPRSRLGIKTQSMSRGMQAGCSFAEAFYLVRELK
ncbi:PIG-L deacetylase family protein [Leptospira vanthielii]|nr:PIG-L family deacetylase [Leptospira vanthielii]